MNIVECLKDIFQNINNWLCFAEGKNAALVGFDIALLAINDNFLENMSSCGGIGFYLFLFGLLFPIASFFPIYKGIKVKKKEKTKSNLLFYGDIVSYDSEKYYMALKESYLTNCDIDEAEENLLRDYAEEIVINSEITVYKLFMFKIGLLFSVLFIIYVVLFNTIL